MQKIRRDDEIIVIAGKDKGKRGKVLKVLADDRLVVGGINLVKRHTKPNQKAPQGGIITKEAPMQACKVMLVCPACSKPTRIAKKEVNGKMVRACKKCGEIIDQTK